MKKIKKDVIQLLTSTANNAIPNVSRLRHQKLHDLYTDAGEEPVLLLNPSYVKQAANIIGIKGKKNPLK